MSADAFVTALRAEYVKGVPGAVGDYFDKHGENADFDRIEEEVRNSANKDKTIDAIAQKLGAASAGAKTGGPTTHGAGKDKQPTPAASQKYAAKTQPVAQSPAAALRDTANVGKADAFVAALRAEYVDKYGENADFDKMEEEVRNLGDKDQAIDAIARKLGVASAGPQKGKHKEPVSGGGKKISPEPERDASQEKFDFPGWCNKHSCLSKLVRNGRADAVEDIMKLYGTNKKLDVEYRRLDYGLLKGKHKANEKKVEITDTVESVDNHEGVIQDRGRALKRLQEFRPFLYGGFLLWFFILTAFLINVALADCSTEAGLGEILIPLFTVLPGTAWLIYANDRLLALQSKTTFEGLPLVRLMVTGGFWDSPRLNVILSVTDLYGKITRALFIGRLVKCSGEDYHRGRSTLGGMFTGWVKGEDPGEASEGGILKIFALGFFLSPLVLQNVRMLRSFYSIGRQISEAKSLPMEEPINMQETLDDHFAVADWALLKAPALVFFYAAVPLALEDENDAARIWDLYKTKAIVAASNLVPDSVDSLWLMTIYFSMTAPYMDLYPKLQLALSMLSTVVLAVIAGVFLILENFRLSVILGVAICVSSILPLVWIIGALACSGDTFFSLGLQCVAT